MGRNTELINIAMIGVFIINFSMITGDINSMATTRQPKILKPKELRLTPQSLR